MSQEMEWVSEIVDAVQFIRQETGLKLRWPCQRLVIVPSTKEFSLDYFNQVIASQTNVKTVEIQTKVKGNQLKEKELSFATVFLDVSETPELHAERVSRDLIRQIQATRKKEGLHVTQRITLYVATKSQELQSAIRETEEAVASKVGATKIEVSSTLPQLKKLATGKVDFENETIIFGFTQNLG
jgi:valyl-tRNA synthetase